MSRLRRVLAIAALVVVAGAAVFLMIWDIPPPTSTIEKVIPDDRFPQ
ncbi:MAG: hypothetical protein ACE5LF_03960 [Alphaproteobacteria bacterium]